MVRFDIEVKVFYALNGPQRSASSQISGKDFSLKNQHDRKEYLSFRISHNILEKLSTVLS